MKKLLLMMSLLMTTMTFASEMDSYEKELRNVQNIEYFQFSEAEEVTEKNLLEDPSENTGMVCWATGGPGNYRYQVRPIRKTCYGGPGNYPYTCYVCP